MKQVLTTIHSLVRSFSSVSPQRLYSKYRLVLVLAVIVMLVSSCKKDDHQCKKTVPLKAKFETVEEPFSETEDQITGTGSGTPIGKSTFVVFSNFVDFPLVKGTSTITAANEDQIFSSFSGSVVGPDDNGTLLVTSNNIITGGSGRFVGATGSFIAHGIANTNVPTGTLTLDGTITLDECHGSNGSIKEF